MTDHIHELNEFLAGYRITHEIGPPMSYDQHGNYYVTLMLGGVREDKQDYLMVTATSVELAVETYLKDLVNFSIPYRHIIWRTEPEITKLGHRQWSVFSRLTGYSYRPGSEP